MEPEELEKVVTENLRLAKQNNKMLLKIHHSMVLNRIFRIIYWVLILGSVFGLYFFIQPYIDGFQAYIDNIKTFFQNPQESLNGIFER